MSEENVRMSEDFIAAYNRRDFDAAVKDFHPQVDWVLPDQQDFDSCRGPAQIVRFWEGIDETFDELQLLPQETVDGGDRVAIRLRHRGRGKGSGLELDEELYHQITFFQDGVIVRFEYVQTWEEALEAVRLGSEAELARAAEDELA
jgi:ketosteroid isomerase-like protein